MRLLERLRNVFKFEFFPLSGFAKNILKGIPKGLRRGSRGESILLPPSGLGWSRGVEDVEET